MFTLGSIANEWNRHARRDKVRSFVEREWNRQLERSLLPRITGSRLSSLLFIKGRTLGWQKFAESIPMTHFLNGMKDEDGEVRLGMDLRPLCSGTGIRKEETVRVALKSLESDGLLTKTAGPRGQGVPVNVFMPFSRDWIAKKLIEGGAGVLPAHLPNYFVGEHVASPDGAPWEVLHVEDDVLTVIEIEDIGKRIGSARNVPSSMATRIPLHEWMDFIGEEQK